MVQKFIYFDIGGVLIDFSSGISDLARKLYVSEKKFKEIFLEFDDQMCRGELTPDELLRKYEERCGTKTGIKNFQKYWIGLFSSVSQTHQILEELYDRDTRYEIRIGVFSNIYPDMFEELTQKRLIPKIKYDAKILSCECKLVKPQVEIYKLAEKVAGVSKQDIYFIDDSIRNIKTAKMLGWNAFHFSRESFEETISGLKSFLGLK